MCGGFGVLAKSSSGNSPGETRQNNTIKAFQGLKGIACLSVFMMHAVNFSLVEGFYPTGIPKFVTAFFYNGYIGIFIFFALSGYLISASLGRTLSIVSFLLNRFARIYPVFFTLHLIMFTAGPILDYKFFNEISVQSYAVTFLQNALLLPGFFELNLAQPVAWTLSYEALFYLISALVLWTYRRNETVAWVLGVVAAVVLCTPLIIINASFRFIAIGVVAYLLQNRLRFLIPILQLSFVCIPLALFVAYQWSKSIRQSDGLLTSGCNFSMDALWALSFLAAFLLIILIAKGGGLLDRIFSYSPLIYVGKISYSIYLWHTLVMFGVRMAVTAYSEFLGDASFIIFVASSVLLTAFVAVPSHRFIERSGFEAITKVGRRILDRTGKKKETETLKMAATR